MHTPLEIGFWHDPRLRAAAIRAKYPELGAALARLRQFILTAGTDEGTLPGRSLDEIQAVMELPTCPHCKEGPSAAVLFKVLQEKGFLRRKRKTWYVPGWKQSTAGRYCQIRKYERDRKQEFREAKHKAALEALAVDDTTGTAPGRDGDNTGTGSGNLRSTNKGRPKAGPSGGPLPGGEREALARWEWFEKLHPRLRNPPLCKRLLAALQPDEWAQLQHALPRQAPMYMSRGRKFIPPSDKYLRDQHFWELRAEAPRKEEATQKRKTESKRPPEEDKRTAALRYLMVQLADPELPEKNKEKAREHWIQTYGDRPWEGGAAK